MSQLPRLLSILTLLKSKRMITGPEMAEKFGVSLRTIYRDIRKLELAGVPVITLEGKGYTIMDGYTVSPVHFQEEEVNALITAEKIIARTKNDQLIEHFSRALIKIKSTFKGHIQSKGEMLEDRMMIFGSQGAPVDSSSLTSMQVAMTNFHVMWIRYQKPDQGEITERDIEPLGMYSYEDLWLVIAWCRLRKAYRSFRLDRILQFRMLDEQFEDRNFDFRNYFSECPEDARHP